MGISKRMRAEGFKGPSPLKTLEGPENAGPLPRTDKDPSSRPKKEIPRADDPAYRRRCNACNRGRDWTIGVCVCGCAEFRTGDISPEPESIQAKAGNISTETNSIQAKAGNISTEADSIQAETDEGPQPILASRDNHGFFYRLGSAFYRLGQGPFPDFRSDFRSDLLRPGDAPFPASLSPVGWDSKEGGRGPVRPPLSRLEEEVKAEAERNKRDPLPGQLSWLDPPSPVDLADEERDVRKLVITRRKKRPRKGAPALGQICFLDTNIKTVKEYEEVP